MSILATVVWVSNCRNKSINIVYICLFNNKMKPHLWNVSKCWRISYHGCLYIHFFCVCLWYMDVFTCVFACVCRCIHMCMSMSTGVVFSSSPSHFLFVKQGLSLSLWTCLLGWLASSAGLLSTGSIGVCHHAQIVTHGCWVSASPSSCMVGALPASHFPSNRITLIENTLLQTAEHTKCGRSRN